MFIHPDDQPRIEQQHATNAMCGPGTGVKVFGVKLLKNRSFILHHQFTVQLTFYTALYSFAGSSSLESISSGSSRSSSLCEGRHSTPLVVAAAPSRLPRPPPARRSGAWLGAWLGALVSPPPSHCVSAAGSTRAPMTCPSRGIMDSSGFRARSLACGR